MQIKKGSIIISAENISDSYFANAVILIISHNKNGSIGFVINKKFSRVLNNLEEFKQSKPYLLYDGGPVEKEKLFFIHRKPDLIEGSELINNHIFLNGNFKQAVTNLNNNSMLEEDIKILIGYCGWDEGELEAEIAEESWFVANNNYFTIDVFTTDGNDLWTRVNDNLQQ